MLYFENDYCEGAHPAILQKLTETNFEKVSGYGTDPYCASAREKIRAACAQYLQYGGLPESLLYKAKRKYISGVYQKVLLGDIITRNSIRNDYAVKILIKKIAEAFAKALHPIIPQWE